MKLQVKVVKKQKAKLDNDIVIKAYNNMIKHYEDTIMYLEAQR